MWSNLSLQVLLEERHGALPGKLGRLLVVARPGNVAVEGVLRVFVLILRVADIGGLERGLVARNAFVDPVVIGGVVKQHGCPYSRHDLRTRRLAVERGGSGDAWRSEEHTSE